MSENIPECGGSIWLILTIASGDHFDFDKLFDIVDEDALNPMVGEAEKEARARRELGLREQHQDEALASREKEECEPMQVATEVVVNEMTLSPYSAMKDLRAAAKWLGVSTAGSKQKILDRLNYTIKREERRQATLLALEHMTKDDQPVKDQRLPRLPSKLERRLCNLTHLPYKAWCDVCVMAKAKDNSKKRSFPAPSSTREFPTVQMDFGTVSGGISILVLVDV